MSESEPTADTAQSARQRDMLAQTLDFIRRRELRVLGALPRRRWRRPIASSDPLPRTTLVKTASTINAEVNSGLRGLVELFADGKMRGPRYHCYVLVRRESGELVLERDPICLIVEEAIAEAFGSPKPRPRVIRLDRPRRKRSRPRS